MKIIIKGLITFILNYDYSGWFKRGIDNMAKNTGVGHRDGAVKDRSQTYNPKTESWVKRDSDTGKFIDQKTSNDKPFKGVSKEK